MKRLYQIFCIALALACFGVMPAFAETYTLYDNYGDERYTIEYSVDENGDVTIQKFFYPDTNNAMMEIPETIDGHSVIAIADNAYPTVPWMFSIELPATVTSIGVNAFAECPIGMVYYGGTESDWATLMENTSEQNDRLCSAMVQFTENGFEYRWDEEYNRISIMLYSGPEETTELIIPDTLGGHFVTDIGGDPMYGPMLYRHRNIERVSFPETLITIDDLSFAGLPLKEVTLPPNLEFIIDGCFQNCTELEEITIPDSVYELHSGLLEGCEALTDIYFEGTKTEWEEHSLASVMALHEDVTVHFGEESGQVGDIDDNGDVNMRDALALYRAVSGKTTVADIIVTAADVDGNGFINTRDALQLYQNVSV